MSINLADSRVGLRNRTCTRAREPLFSYSDPNICKHYLLQYNITHTFGSGYETREPPHRKR